MILATKPSSSLSSYRLSIAARDRTEEVGALQVLVVDESDQAHAGERPGTRPFTQCELWVAGQPGPVASQPGRPQRAGEDHKVCTRTQLSGSSSNSETRSEFHNTLTGDCASCQFPPTGVSRCLTCFCNLEIGELPYCLKLLVYTGTVLRRLAARSTINSTINLSLIDCLIDCCICTVVQYAGTPLVCAFTGAILAPGPAVAQGFRHTAHDYAASGAGG